MSGSKTLVDKIRGSMIGAVIGDCLGSPVECQFWEGIEPAVVLNSFISYREEACKLKPRPISYTDDTAMVRQRLLNFLPWSDFWRHKICFNNSETPIKRLPVLSTDASKAFNVLFLVI